MKEAELILSVEKICYAHVGNKEGRKVNETTKCHLKIGNQTINEVNELKVIGFNIHKVRTGTR